ncbi:MAG: nucleotidyl transferase AbiEii/AbiGii toxin family protein, partial [Clostridia bacterium]|nr:nucleotidyl transferase AbiEii/AbiGii toxin family protein [Clostridia bacterium]
ALWQGYCRERAAGGAARRRVLAPAARALLRLAARHLAPRGFELAGGAALAAVHLGHRRAVDLDFFAPGGAAGDRFHRAVEAFAAALEAAGLGPVVEAQGPAFARLRAGRPPLAMELATHEPFRLEPPDARLEGMPVHSLTDLAADKVLALFGRAAERDYVDLYFLLERRYELEELMALALRKDARFRPGLFARMLARAAELPLRPEGLLLPAEPERVRATLVAAAHRLLRRRLGER